MSYAVPIVAAMPAPAVLRASRVPEAFSAGDPMTERSAERIPRARRLRTSLEYAAVKGGARAMRGRHCILLALDRPDEPTRVGFIASRRSVGGAVQRNRARRRLKEIVRRRWSRVADRGRWLVFVALGTARTAPHAELAAEVERLLAQAGVLGAPESGR